MRAKDRKGMRARILLGNTLGVLRRIQDGFSVLHLKFWGMEWTRDRIHRLVQKWIELLIESFLNYKFFSQWKWWLCTKFLIMGFLRSCFIPTIPPRTLWLLFYFDWCRNWGQGESVHLIILFVFFPLQSTPKSRVGRLGRLQMRPTYQTKHRRKNQ